MTTPEYDPMEAWLTARAERAKRWAPLVAALYVVLATLVLTALLDGPAWQTLAAGLLAAGMVAVVLRHRQRVTAASDGQ